MRAARILAMIFLAITLASGCFTTTPLQRVMTMGISDGYKAKQIQRAIQKAAQHRGWILRKKGKSKYISTLNHRGHMVKVEIKYSKTNIKFTYLDSKEMKYDGKKIHKKYHMWIDRFQASVRQNL